jgi:NAD(P)-dependent dehydrogenase (short-subunit alcohol dehydrogenase family)
MTKLEGTHLRERIALIIGAGVSQGIGFSTADAMAAAEATVALAQLPNSSERNSLGRLAPSVGHSAYHVDLFLPDSVAGLVTELVAQRGRIEHPDQCHRELAGYNITANSLCPGSTTTSLLMDNQAAGDPPRLDGIIHGSIEQWRSGIPLGRLAEPDDQAANLCLSRKRSC